MRYSRFRREKAQALESQAREAERTAAEIARLERFVERWRAGTKAKQAASRQKRLSRIERVDGPRSRRSLEFGFPPVTAAGRVVMEAHGLEVRVGDTTLLRDVDLVIERGERVALVGPNGAGKTTLVDTLLGVRRAAAGRVSLGHRVEPAFFSQHGVELRDDRTVVDSLLADTALTRTQARTLLGAFMFPGEAADRRVADLSGGERRRLSLAALVARGGNLLVLDEPTNHLDAESREALEVALLAYAGTLLLITHDRALIDAVATRTLSIEDGRLVSREGGWAELVRARQDAPAAPPAPAAPAPRAPARTSSGKASPRKAPPTPAAERAEARGGSPGKRVRRLETRVARLESELVEVEAALAAPGDLDGGRLAELGERHRALQEDIAWALAEWERAAEAAGV
jgi:ATP-binding cassette subfamily F protein 3